MRGGKHEDYIREMTFADSRLCVGNPLTDFHGVLTGVPIYTGSAATLEQATRR